MEPEEIAELTERDRIDLIDGEEQPGGEIGEGLQWREKDRLLGLRNSDGRLLALAGAGIVEVEVEDAGSFEVVGLGGLFVTRSVRGGGLLWRLADPLLAIAAEMGPDRAMMFCKADLVPVYRRLGFAEIDSSVWADQAEGRVEVPMRAMWRALREGAVWPPGRVDVRGLPF